MSVVRITQLDGKLPNLALMRLSAWHKAQGDEVHFHRSATPELFEPAYDVVYGSAIFSATAKRLQRFQSNFPDAIVGGTGTTSKASVEDIVPPQFTALDYDPWRDFTASLGFTQRGCRLSCKFCVVPGKEGAPKSVASVREIWRGAPHPKHLHLLDNDFFGQPEEAWRSRIDEIREGGFKVCFNQGINVRAITDQTAAALASVEFRDDSFKRRRLYTAWDNLKDEVVFFAGVDRLEAAGVPARQLMAYMLVGFAKGEDWPRLFRRFDKMIERGIVPYPMVYGDKRRTLAVGDMGARYERKTLGDFQRWVLTGIYRSGISFIDYRVSARASDRGGTGQGDLFEAVA